MAPIQVRGGGSFYLKRFKRIGVPFIAWSLFYACFYYLLIPLLKHESDFPLDWREYITIFINGKYNGHMWFFVPLLALYLTIPFLNAFFRSASDNVVRLMANLAFLFCCLLPFVFALFGIGYFSREIFPLGADLLIYGYMGYVLVRTHIYATVNVKRLYTLVLCCVAIHFFGMIIVMNVFNGSERTFTDYTSPTSFIMAMGVFLWFKEQDWQAFIAKIHLTPALVQKISSCSFGVYLFHGFVLSCIGHFGLDFLSNRYFGFFFVYAVSLVCILIMKRTPVVKTIVP